MKILLTGITGTIGIAFTELLLEEGHKVYGVDHNEERVAQLKTKYPDIHVALGDFSNVDFEDKGFDLLIHLAAFKHIDLCEKNTVACVMNNVIDTHHLFRNAYKNKVKILFMSTDKAVEPTSMYGFSKALGEGMAREYGGAFARSGNVIASNGSVMKIWDDAIEQGEPLKLTHKDIKRFFISPESLVKQIWTQYKAGVKEIIPEMDREVYLIELAEEKLNKVGRSIKDYPIEYIGLRPGEKLSEVLQWPK